MTRSELLGRLEQKTEWDIVVIGGGATGLGIALEAASRNYKVLLLEQSDFAKSTSSKSTKLIHGGVRYLAQGHFGLVREASIERAVLHRNAPHLVTNQRFVIPVYNIWDAVKFSVGLRLYDWIAGGLSLGSSRFISRQETMNRLPNINSHKLVGGITYHDGQFDDARLAINLAQTIIEAGGTPVNYMKVSGVIKDDNGRIAGVHARDPETGKQYSISSKSVINATGVFADDILQMDDPLAEKTICVSQGIHLVLDKKFHPSDHALMIPKTADGRVLFVIPWHNKVVVGTTDTPVPHSSLEPVALEGEIKFILETASSFLQEKPVRKDVQSVFAGLRPLAAAKGKKMRTKEISRSHKIIVSSSHLFTIVGGKWTTYRKMGEDMIDRVEKELRWSPTSTTTALMPIHGWQKKTDHEDPFSFYGKDQFKINENIHADPHGWISKDLNLHKAQVLWAVEKEMARTVEDVLARRTRVLLLDAKESTRVAPQVAAIMAEILLKDQDWVEQQVQEYTSLAKNYILK